MRIAAAQLPLEKLPISGAASHGRGSNKHRFRRRNVLDRRICRRWIPMGFDSLRRKQGPEAR